MKRNRASQSAPSLRLQSAPTDGVTSLPSIWSSSANNKPERQRAGGSAASSQFGLFPKSRSASMLHALKIHSQVRSPSPQRPGTTGVLPGRSRAATPYLLSGLTGAAELNNSRSIIFEQKMHEQEALAETSQSFWPAESDGMARQQTVMPTEMDFHMATDSLQKSLNNLHWKLEAFDPQSPSPQNRRSSVGKLFKAASSQEDDDDEEGDSLRERFEQYKMVRKIEPELPPLIPLPPSSSSYRLPDTPLIEYNLSQDALEKCMGPARMEAALKKKSVREQLMTQSSARRDNMLEINKDMWQKVLDQKKQQAENVLIARREGISGIKNSNQSVSKDVIAEKWAVAYALVTFLKSAREEVVFHRKTPDERMKVIKERQASGNSKRSDEFHVRAMQMGELMQDGCTIGRLEMMGRLFQSKRCIHAKREQARLATLCLFKWQSRAHIFHVFKAFKDKVKYLQEWWRRTSMRLKEVRENIAKRWERIEKLGTSGYQDSANAECPLFHEPVEPARRNVFLENELRSRRFFLLPMISMWEEDAARWRAEQLVKKEKGMRPTFDLEELPLRPSHLPANHCSSKRPRGDWCLGPQGDQEILAMIKACRNHPNGGGWKQVPQMKAKCKQGGAKKPNAGSDQQADAPAAARLFGEADAADLERWGVRQADMPQIGEKPGIDEGEGRYP